MAKKGRRVVEMNLAAIDRAASALKKARRLMLGAPLSILQQSSKPVPEFVERIQAPIRHGEGDELPGVLSRTWKTAPTR